MHQVQDMLEFGIETPSDAELRQRFYRDGDRAKTFAEHQKTVKVKQSAQRKHKKRCQKNAKKLARAK